MAATAPSPKLQRKNGTTLFLVAGFLLLAGANAGFWFYRTKAHVTRMHIPGMHDPRLKPGLCETSGDPCGLESVTLAPFLANLAAGEGYVKVTIALSIRKGEQSATRNTADAGADAGVVQSAVVRDTILGDLSTQSASVLLTTDGKEALKKTLKADLHAKVPGLELEEIYFTDFLVQQ